MVLGYKVAAKTYTLGATVYTLAPNVYTLGATGYTLGANVYPAGATGYTLGATDYPIMTIVNMKFGTIEQIILEWSPQPPPYLSDSSAYSESSAF